MALYSAFSPSRILIKFPAIFLYLSVLVLTFISIPAHAQSVTIGNGSYSTSLPSGAVGPSNASGASVTPKVSPGFSQPAQTNDFWSSLIYPFYGDPHSNVIYAHPLNVKARGNGLQMGYTTGHVFAANDYLYPFYNQLTVGVKGLNASQTLTDSYGDWTVTALWEQSNISMEATIGHGLPYVFFRIEGGDAVISTSSTANIWHQKDEVLGVTIDGRHYGIFAPTGSTWSTTSNLESDLNGQNYLSVALLHDASTETLELFRKHAYAFVTNSRVEWQYNEQTALVTTDFIYETELMDGAEGNLNETLSALYRHQWMYSNDALTSHTYNSPRGTMKLHEGNTFSTEIYFAGVLPALPDRGDYNRDQLLGFVEEAANGTLGVGPSYENGKQMARFANLVHIADQIGAIEERDHFLSELKNRLEDWLTAGGSQEYSYNDDWDVLTGYPSGYGADNQINDHHFHSSYAIQSAATIARFDSAWAVQENWGGMINLLIKDSNNWDRTDTQFPFLRSHDAYAGHSWAAGHGDFGDGNNQESSSESMNFASAVVLWGEATQQKDVRDLGAFLHSTEMIAVEQYWFDVYDEVFPEGYPHVAIGMVWGGKGVHSTWFGADPEFIHGINLLPITSGSLYLGRHPEYVKKNYEEIVSENNGQPDIWQDILWQYLSLSDPNQAISYYYADNNYAPFDGESRAHTLHWLFNMKKMGHVDTATYADIPTYAVFKDRNGDKTYIAYNSTSAERLVTFSDGHTLTVAPREMASETTSDENPEAPVITLIADKTRGKAPLTVNFQGSNSFDRNGESLTYEWNFGDMGSSSAADTSFTFTEVGTYQVTLTITNEQDLTASDSVSIEVLDNGTPFNGTPFEVPGRIEAEDYDLGGEGIAYHDVDENNIGLAYRPDEGVDIEGANDGGFDVYWIVDGEWIEYTFEVVEDGYYIFKPYVATVPGFGYFHLYIDNEDISGRKNVTGTGGWQNWTPVEIEETYLEAGVHRMRYEFGSDSDKEGWLLSLNYTNVEKTPTTSTEDDLKPESFTLKQNYPNPFNPSTNISYTIPESGMVKLTVYNALGQNISTLVSEQQSAGSYTYQFEAQNIPSGIYFYKLESNGQVRTNKMLLIK